MPPPKKPKCGRTSLEQFLSEEERRNSILSCHHLTRDSEGNSPVSSVDLESSDGEVFDQTTKTCKPDEERRSGSEQNENLFQKLFRKSHSVDEQKVPGSPDEDIPSPTSSPTIESSERMTAFRKYQDHVRMQMEQRQRDHEDNSLYSSRVRLSPAMLSMYQRCKGSVEMCDTKTFVKAQPRSPESDVKLTTEQGRLIDSLVASALASNAAQTIIYGHHQQEAAVSMATSGTPICQSVSFSTRTGSKGYDPEPHDLSKKSKLQDQKQFENIGTTGELVNGLGARDVRDVTVDRSKSYLEAHRRIASLLAERREEAQRRQDQTLVQGMDKENIIQSPVPGTRYPNGFFHPASMTSVMNGFPTYNHHQRETIEHPMSKVDESGCLISPGNYLPLPTMMPPTSGVSQAPTSTTLDIGDPRERYHPALMSPHFLAESRRIKTEHTHGVSVNKLCQVCSDNASGFHYGVWSCEGCKAFFKRSIQGPVDYVCPATNSCTIDKHRRKSCQACRLRKCYEVGMNKGSQRKERKSSANTNKSPKRPRLDSDSVNGMDTYNPTPAKNPRRSRASVILEALGKADLPSLQSFHNHNLPPTREHLLNSLVKLAERELVLLINWAKNVPGYTELSLGDQVHLIECCWMELLLLNCAFRSMEHNGRQLVFAPDLILERPYWSMLGMSDILEQIAAVSEQLVQYNLHKEELLLLQATVLANAEVRKLASYSKLHTIQQSILDSLVDVAQKYHPNNLRHIPSLLLLLTHVRQAAERATAYFQSVKKEGTVTFCDLLTEMLDAQSEDKRSTSSPSTSSS